MIVGCVKSKVKHKPHRVEPTQHILLPLELQSPLPTMQQAQCWMGRKAPIASSSKNQPFKQSPNDLRLIQPNGVKLYLPGVMASQGTVKRSTLGSVEVSLSWPNLVSQALGVLENSPPTLSGADLTSALTLGQNVRRLRRVTCHFSLSMTVLSESMFKMPYP